MHQISSPVNFKAINYAKTKTLPLLSPMKNGLAKFLMREILPYGKSAKINRIRETEVVELPCI
jgi:hypothetical protein